MSNEKVLDTLILEKCDKDKCLEYAKIDNPVLMSNVEAFEKFKLNKKFTTNFYNIDKRFTSYNNVKMTFDQTKYDKVFGPNIDTILFCAALDKVKSTCKSFIEIGIGSGFISLYYATKYPKAHGTLIDIEEQAITCAKDDLNLPNIKKSKWITVEQCDFKNVYQQKNYTLIEGDALKMISKILGGKWKSKYDILLCNPPYIPKGDELKIVDPNDSRIAKNFFEGTYLMRYILTNADKLAEKGIITILSSTSFQVNHVKNELQMLYLQGWDIKILVSQTVPLKVYNENLKYIHDDKQWSSYLTHDTGNITIGNNQFFKGALRDETKLFPLQHIVYVVSIFRSKKKITRV